ncbi:MAG TPA: hypothetical protein VM840_00740 [Actinomycetota bacterium]|nr:hypothetical protein [Actinomycetota bacterium]
MRKLATLAVAVLAAGVLGAGPALADDHLDDEGNHRNSCSETTVFYGGDTSGGYLFVCGGNGFAGGEIDSSGNGYVLADGSESNPDLSSGYVVVKAGPAGVSVGCSSSGDWNKGQGTTCP